MICDWADLTLTNSYFIEYLHLLQGMFTRIYWIETFENGAALGLMARPRGNDWLEDEVKNLKLKTVQTVVSLLERAEIYELGLSEEEALCQKYGINFIHFPIEDRGLPTNQEATKHLVQTLQQRLHAGEKVVVHCRMGIGRSSIIAGAVLLKNDLTADTIFDKISQVRQLNVPDTQGQVNWLKQFE